MPALWPGRRLGMGLLHVLGLLLHVLLWHSGMLCRRSIVLWLLDVLLWHSMLCGSSIVLWLLHGVLLCRCIVAAGSGRVAHSRVSAGMVCCRGSMTGCGGSMCSSGMSFGPELLAAGFAHGCGSRFAVIDRGKLAFILTGTGLVRLLGRGGLHMALGHGAALGLCRLRSGATGAVKTSMVDDRIIYRVVYVSIVYAAADLPHCRIIPE
jgi:hypothetical protein